MEGFSALIETWQVFYTTVALASATLAGLLFVSMTAHVDRLFRAENSASKRVARHTFGNFLYVMIMSMIFLVPSASPTGVGAGLVVLGCMGEFDTLSLIREHVRGPRWYECVRPSLHHFGLGLLAYMGIIAMGFSIVRGYTDTLLWAVFILILLLISASRNAWVMLVSFRERE